VGCETTTCSSGSSASSGGVGDGPGSGGAGRGASKRSQIRCHSGRRASRGRGGRLIGGLRSPASCSTVHVWWVNESMAEHASWTGQAGRLGRGRINEGCPRL
jgi:hypothetical protein